MISLCPTLSLQFSSGLLINGVWVSGVGVEVWVIVEVITEVVGKGKSGSACRVGVKQVGAEVDLEERCFLDTKPKLIPLGVLHEKEVDVERGLFVIKKF